MLRSSSVGMSGGCSVTPMTTLYSSDAMPVAAKKSASPMTNWSRR